MRCLPMSSRACCLCSPSTFPTICWRSCTGSRSLRHALVVFHYCSYCRWMKRSARKINVAQNGCYDGCFVCEPTYASNFLAQKMTMALRDNVSFESNKDFGIFRAVSNSFSAPASLSSNHNASMQNNFVHHRVNSSRQATGWPTTLDNHSARPSIVTSKIKQALTFC